jgi:(S)-2-hydroxy-acid oxidase
VGVGKPMFFALAVDGERGLMTMIQLLKQETEAAMALCGCRTVNDITRQHVARHPSGIAVGRYIRSSL